MAFLSRVHSLTPVAAVPPRRHILAAIALCVVSGSVFAQNTQTDQFALGVRETQPLTPEQQLATFHLPPGFKIQLVAAEPQIAKPMNLAFDARGRLWVTSSLEYPFAAAEGADHRDTVRILEDTDGDARADVVTTFADGLNIPIGLSPYKDGVICYSIPNILHLQDTDGDGIADRRDVLYGPFDTTRDTHGMCNAFRRGEDGWIYACHGFNNQSTVTGKDGNTVVMQSGNTFRFRPDGSRIEHYTHGQVNPFGMAMDRNGDILTADCHTKPITLLIQNGYYESFGKPHDGLGFVPNVMEHLHGSTAIAGIALGQMTAFPKEFQDNTFGGNVMTSRINSNQLVRRGSTVQAVQQPDFLSCDDPWFRPVDLVVGPDGALYVADFYNRIIGHYEVPLLHPGRDRFRGRIWRISYEGDAPPANSPARFSGDDLTALSNEQLVSRLGTAGDIRARLIADRIADTITDDSQQAVVALLRRQVAGDSVAGRRRALWLLHRLNQLDGTLLSEACADREAVVRIHGFRALREASAVIDDATSAKLIAAGLQDADALVRRTAATTAGGRPASSLIPRLIQAYHEATENDIHLRHAIRMALRDHLQHDDWFRATARTIDEADVALLAGICLALKTPAAGEFIAAHVSELADIDPTSIADYLQFAAQYVSPAAADTVVVAVRQRFDGQSEQQRELVSAMQAGFVARRQAVPQSVRELALELALKYLHLESPAQYESLTATAVLGWTWVPPEGARSQDSTWGTTDSRRCADGVSGVTLFSSFEKGERRVGTYRSAAFDAPETLEFFVAGHDGSPDKPMLNNNFVRLIDAASSEVLRQASPPRNDVAQLVRWDTADCKGRSVVVELVDGDAGTAYAWLAVGRFSIDALNPSTATAERTKAAALIGDFGLTELRPALVKLLKSPSLDSSEQSHLARALTQLQPSAVRSALSLAPLVKGIAAETVTLAIDTLLDGQADQFDQATDVLGKVFQVATTAEQQVLAETLAQDKAGAETLVSLAEAGLASTRLLKRPSVRQRMAVTATEAMQQRIAALVINLPDEDAAVEQLIVATRTDWHQQSGDVAAGAELFKKNCSICHQIAGEGKKVGPNLDGIGNRGLDRLTEDLLAPNRNVDVAFRTTTVATTDGRALSGLLRELEPGRISIIDNKGQETLLATDDVEERVGSALSPMPANFGELLNAQQLRDLLSFLMSVRK